MSRPLFAALMLLGSAFPAFSQAQDALGAVRPPHALASALAAGDAGRWDRAEALAAREGRVALKLIEWARLRTGAGTLDEVLAFLNAHPGWPGLERLRVQSLESLEGASDMEVVRFYEGAAPQTGEGVLRQAAALGALGRDAAAQEAVIDAWRSFDLSSEEHAAFMAEYGAILAPHHAARMDMALWRGLRDASLMLPLVEDDLRARAEIRMSAADGARGIEARIKALPDEVQRDPGIAHALFERYIDTDKPEEAMDLMLRQSRIEGGLGEAARWSGWRRNFARRMMFDGQYARAYDLAAHHQLDGGGAFADLEWLSGYLALRFMDDPALALDHFQRLRGAVVTPISLGRAHYWIGRAQEALGDPEAARFAYEQGAGEQTSFYGLLAAEKAGMPFDPVLAGDEAFTPWREAAFTRSDAFQAITLLAAAGQLTYAEWFVTALADTLGRDDLGSLGLALADIGQPHLEVMLGKAAASRGIVLPAPYYALHPMRAMDLPVPMELALAIARRESEFDHRVASGAGALGLMQVLPGTASDVARDLGISHDPGRVLTDWRYNARLGATYLAQMSERFDGNIVMIAAAYNAGPARPPRWMSERGDPRGDGIGMGDFDVIDWIEFIPFSETRNYVQRVAESLPIYRARLGKEPHPIPFSQELRGATIPSDLD